MRDYAPLLEKPQKMNRKEKKTLNIAMGCGTCMLVIFAVLLYSQTAMNGLGVAAAQDISKIKAIKDIFMPALSSTMTEGKIVSWLKNPGDRVAKGESVAIVESDKADMDVEAFDEGILATIVVPEGGMTGVGNAIAYLIEAAKAQAGSAAPPAAPQTAPAAIEAKPAAPAAPAPAQPVVVSSPVIATAPQPRADGRIIASPLAKVRAKELGVDLAVVGGSGPNGRITESDVERVAFGGTTGMASAVGMQEAQPMPVLPSSSTPPAPAVAAPSVSSIEQDPELPARGSVEKFTTLQVVFITDKLDEMYKALKPKGVAMSPLLAKAVGLALAKHPVLYASCPDGNSIKYNEHVNVAIAVAMPDGGLITPVLSDADAKDVSTLASSWKDLLGRARSKQLKPEEYSSGTFTISNLGMFGVDAFKPILPPGTAAIMSVGASKPTVVAGDDGSMKVEKQMTVGLAADHRIVYGAHAAEFLRDLKEIIENPVQLLV
eukprot:jgi/Bigna1/92269/estExt_fgenesh1_pm.C_110002